MGELVGDMEEREEKERNKKVRVGFPWAKAMQVGQGKGDEKRKYNIGWYELRP